MKPIEVLMVEDNRGDVVLMQEAIQSLGLYYHLHVACNGVDALEFLRRQGRHTEAVVPDLILLDLKLPKKTGVEVLDEIQLDETLREIPIVVVSSSTSELNVARLRKNPPYACIVKPGTFGGYIELVQAIETFRKTRKKERIP